MKFRSKKILLTSTIFLMGSSSLPILFVNSCIKTEKDNQRESKILKFYEEKDIDINPYSLDFSTIMNTNIESNNILYSSVAPQLFRAKTISAPAYKKNSSYGLENSGLYAYKFELAEKIIIHKSDGEVVHFDSDDYKIEQKNNGEIYEKLMSDNDKSINSQNFIDSMNSATKIEIKIKDNIYWVDSKGNKTNYLVNAEDFWFSYLRSYYNGFFQRTFTGQNGSPSISMNIDAQNRIRLKDLSNKRFGSVLFTNNQQFEIHGISSGKFIEFDSEFNSINSVKENKLIFEQDPDYKNVKNFMEFFDLMLVNSLIFSPAPSQYIKELSKKHNEYFTKDDQEIPLYGYGIIKNIGLYFYGTNGWENNLYAGPYIPNSTSSSHNKILLTKNKHYWDKQFVESNKTIEQIEFNYSQNDSILNFNKIKSEKNSLINFLSLTPEQQNYININLDKFNLIPYKKYNNTKSVGNNAFNITPKPNELVNADSKFALNSVDYNSIAFNDNYSKIVYGSSINEIQQGFRGEFDSKTSISSGVFDNKSIAFRSIINASLNWTYIKDTLNVNSQLWLTNAAPDTKIGGNNQSTSKFKTVRDANDIINDLIVINERGEKINLEKSNSNQIKSSNFELLKNQMNILLNSLFDNSELKLNKNEKITWYIYNNRLINQNERNMFEQMIQTIKGLDERLNPIFVYLPTQIEINKVLGSYNGGGNNSISQFITYSYEKNDLSPYLDKITHAIGLSPFALWYKFSMLNDEDILALNFPALTRFSKTMKEKFEDGFLKLNEIYVKEDNQFRKIVWDDLNKFNSYEERNLYLRGIQKPDEENKTGFVNVGFGGLGYLWDPVKKIFKIDNIIEQAKFANYYLKITTNEELIQLLRELNTFRSFNIDLDKNIDSINFLDYKIVNKDVLYEIPFNDVIYVQDIKLK